MSLLFFVIFFFFKQKTAYEMRISDWSSDVCSSDLRICHYSVTPAFTVNGPSSATNLTPPDGVMCKFHQIFASSPASVAASIAHIVASGISRSNALARTPPSVVTDLTLTVMSPRTTPPSFRPHPRAVNVAQIEQAPVGDNG